MQKRVLTLLLGVLPLLSMTLLDRAEAATILNVNPTFSGSAAILGGPGCSFQGSTSVGCSVGNPGDFANGFASFNASGSFSQNSVQFSSGAFFFYGSASASTNAQLGTISDPIVISLSCQTSGQGFANFFDVTTSLSLFECSSTLFSGPFLISILEHAY